MELEALNIIKSLVISSTRNESGSNLGWFLVFLLGLYFFGYLPGFLNPIVNKLFTALTVSGI